MPTHCEIYHVRRNECDAQRHVNNAVYQHYLEQATLDSWANAGCDASWFSAHKVGWFLKQASIEYKHPAVVNDVLDVTTWLLDSEDSGIHHEYEFRRQSDGKLIAAARACWIYVDQATGKPHETPVGIRVLFGEPGLEAVKPYRLAAQALATGSFHWQHQIRRYEVDASQSVNPAIYLNWIEEAKFRAAATVNWPIVRMLAENFVTFQTRQDTEYFQAARYGDEIDIVSRLYDLRKVRGTWLHEFYRQGSRELIARNYSTGAFLDLNGHPAPAPQAMLEALLNGQDDPSLTK